MTDTIKSGPTSALQSDEAANELITALSTLLLLRVAAADPTSRLNRLPAEERERVIARALSTIDGTTEVRSQNPS